MNITRLWPVVQSASRSFFGNRGELLQQSLKTYNTTNHSSNSSNDYQKLCSPYPSHLSSFTKVGNGSYLKIITRTLAGEAVHYCREFANNENDQVHSILCSLPGCQTTTYNNKTDPLLALKVSAPSILDMCKNYSALDPEELVANFVNLAVNSSHGLSSSSTSDLCLALSKKATNLSYDDMIKVFSAMTCWQTPHSSSDGFQQLSTSMLSICSTSVKHWNPEEALLAADYCYKLGLSKNTNFYRKLQFQVGKQLSAINATQTVQYLFYSHLSRENLANAYGLQKKLSNEIDKLTADELGIIAMSFFKTSTPITSSVLIDKMTEVLLDNRMPISSTSQGSLLKALRTNIPTTMKEPFARILDGLQLRIDDMHNFALSQVLMFSAASLVLNEDILEKIIERFSENMAQFRLKDIEKLTYTLMVFKYNSKTCPDIFPRIIQELRQPARLVEINHFPNSFVCCVTYLSSAGWYPIDLISAVFQPSMIEYVTGADSGQSSARSLRELHWNLVIEGPPNYVGYTLSSRICNYLTEQFYGRIPTPNSQNLTRLENMILDIQSKLQYFECSSTIVHVLPHYTVPDIVFCTNALGEPVPIPDEYFLSAYPCSLRLPVNCGLIWNVVIALSTNAMIYPRNYGVKGNMECKIRQLHRLGYKVSMIESTYTKRSQRHKFLEVEHQLKSRSSLNVAGKADLAFSRFSQIRDIQNTQKIASSNG